MNDVNEFTIMPLRNKSYNILLHICINVTFKERVFELDSHLLSIEEIADIVQKDLELRQ